MNATSAIQSIEKPTPILDRLQPMPNAEARTSWYDWTWQILIGLITLLLVAFSALGLPLVGQRLAGSDIPKIGWIAGILFFLAVSIMAITVHELGHFLVGKWAGFRFRYICIGPIRLDHSLNFSYTRNRGTRLGAVCFFPAEMRNHPWKYMLMVFAGPIANIVCAIVCLLPFDKSFFLVIFGGISAYLGIVNLAPARKGFFTTDGLKILTILFSRTKHERTLAVVQIVDEIKSGTDPETLSSDLIYQAISVRDNSWMTVIAYTMAYARAYNEKDNCAAAYYLETCLEFSGQALSNINAALIADAAIFQAKRRGNVALAEQWLADLRKLADPKSFCLRAEGAIFEARGDFKGALAKIAECEQTAQGMANQRLKQRLLVKLDEWKKEVEEKLINEQRATSMSASV
jgi:hypothetical protein